MNFAGRLGSSMSSLAKRAKSLLTRGCLVPRCMDASTQVWTPSGPVELSLLRLGDLVVTDGDRTVDAAGGEANEYGLLDVLRLGFEMKGQIYRPLAVRISRADGSKTDIEQLVPVQRLAALGLDRGYSDHGDEKIEFWLEEHSWANRAGRHIDSPGFAHVLSVGCEVFIGGGISSPRIDAAPIMGRYVTTEATLLSFEIAGSATPILMTRDHPVWIEEVGGWADAGTAAPGQHLRDRNGKAQVRSISVAKAGQTVYNISVAGGHTYFVGDNQTWVHNCGAGAHHVWPVYWGGSRSGGAVTGKLTSSEHTMLHQFIDEAGAVFGIP